MAAREEDEADRSFASRVQSAIATAQAWDADPTLLAECRSLIPFEELRRNDGGGDTGSRWGLYGDPTDRCLGPDARFVQRLARFFKQSMTWVNSPPCSVCGSVETMKHQETRGPQTAEEREGDAHRVEVYVCGRPGCDGATTTFPRYNSVRKLLETRQGRCGEYANLFGLVCRSCGLETRYVSDWTDHVWTEVRLVECGGGGGGCGDSWIMVDSCEGVLGEPGMYESGWGKSLSYAVGAAIDHVVDVTPRYTRQFLTADFQARRRAVTSGEPAGQEILRRANATLQGGLGPRARSELERRLAGEERLLSVCRNTTHWEREYGRGRISGSLAWKVARQEAGPTGGGKEDNETKKDEPAPPPESFQVESFFPPTPSSGASFAVFPTPKSRHDGTVVSGTSCAVGNPDTLSVVVADEQYLGCILQSRSFSSLAAVADFVDTVPTRRIVAVQGSLPAAGAHVTATVKNRLAKQLGGGFDCDSVADGVLFIGQVRARPDWACGGSFASAPHGFRVVVQTPGKSTPRGSTLKLSTRRRTRPSCIAGRLPESVMPLQTQLLANQEQKRIAFLSYLENEGSESTVSGYATMSKAPVYLLGSSSYPLERIESDEGDSWTSFLLLPPPLVADDDVGIVDETANKTDAEAPNFDVPLESTFFTAHLGSELLINRNGSATKTDTLTGLHNARLIGLYFSAHWCGPCRSFTPMLAKMYQHLKDAFPSHGLEIVFVSSDRDVTSFDRYYASMPWAAVPFDSPSFPSYKQMLSTTYGIQGIPSLVVLDAMSGQVIVSTATSRKEVMEACQGGEDRIEDMFRSWLSRAPAETKEMISMLELSCTVTTQETASSTEDQEAVNPYLVRPTSQSSDLASNNNSSTKDVTAAKVKAKFAQLVHEGMSPNVAAARAIEVVASGSQDDDDANDDGQQRDTDPLAGQFEQQQQKDGSHENDWTSNVIDDKDDRSVIISTLLKYVDNAVDAPWTPKFRHFKMSNKVADRITRVAGGIDWMRSFGLEIVGTDEDFYGSIPIAADLDRLQARLNEILLQQEQQPSSSSSPKE